MSVNTIQNYSVLGLLLLAVACGKKDQPGAMQGPPPAGVVLHARATNAARQVIRVVRMVSAYGDG